MAKMSAPELWHAGLAAFAARDYFDVHEYLEELWRRVPPADKGPVQGLLQAAVCLYHFGNGNFAGARILAVAACQKLQAAPEEYRGLALGRFLQQFEAVTAPLHKPGERLRPMRPDQSPAPQQAV
ncbi:MAG: DUF309 domain-containing protein [Planctomycetes bacterium]|nr:DUF309 domain-containing protein [Planctomycetota bacterium]